MDIENPPQDIAVLAGNGLSIAFNQNLTIPNITGVIVERLDAAGNTASPAAQLMQAVAQRAGANNAHVNFEALVGPLDFFRDGLTMMNQLAGLAGERQLAVARSLMESADFADEVRRHAVSHILEVISAESIAHVDEMGPVYDFVDLIVECANGGEVTFGNLNYDALLMAALCDRHQHRLCDLTDARYNLQRIDVVPDYPFGFGGRPLRTDGSLPSRRVTLLHLHGSLGWLYHPPTNRYMRFGIEDLRDSGYWREWREGRTEWEPVVVLTNQHSKTSLVSQYPFKLAYDLFFSRLLTADKWLLAGTALQDACVNEQLQKAWRMRSTVPHVMVVTHGAGPTDAEILNAIGYDPIWGGDPDPSHWLGIHRSGIETVKQSLPWMEWTWATAPLARAKAS